jgi:hypothetical protein
MKKTLKENSLIIKIAFYAFVGLLVSDMTNKER